MKSTKKIVILGICMTMLHGCATSRGVIDVNEEVASNPAAGVDVKIVRVDDKRRFEIDPRQANIPSLKNDEIHDKAITSRAIARKRNSYGKALGDILLPEGKTVMSLVEDSLTNGLRENGFRVLDEGDVGYDNAAPIEVDIEKFWGWFSPGFWKIGINFEILLQIWGPIDPFVDGESFDSQVKMTFMAAGEDNWIETIDAALEALNRDIAEELKQ